MKSARPRKNEKRKKRKEAEEKKPEASPTSKKPEEKTKKPVVVKVDTDGIQNRIVGLEITPGNYRNIRMLDDNRIFYLRRTAGDEVGRMTKGYSRTKTRNRISALTISTTVRRP